MKSQISRLFHGSTISDRKRNGAIELRPDDSKHKMCILSWNDLEPEAIMICARPEIRAAYGFAANWRKKIGPFCSKIACWPGFRTHGGCYRWP